MTFHIITLGCKVNIYESEMMKELLEKKGYVYSEDELTDITIINTCSVTNMADKKSQKIVRHAKRNNPNTILVVAGCSSENKEELYKTMDIDILIGNKDKSKIDSLIETYLKDKKTISNFYHTRNLPFESMLVSRFQSHTRAFVKIQDGCNNFCSYCIIPYVRGTLRSKKMESVLSEVNLLVENGHNEIVLTGINTGKYGENESYDLSDLLHELEKIKNLKRIRISSIEVTELNDKFLNELKNNSKICNHLHIPLQAGSDEILKSMNRKYDLKFFTDKIQKIREIRPNISITTDVIVGFPGESEQLFEETLNTVEKLKFSKVHAFPYSKREKTPAAIKKDQIEEFIKKERNRKLIALSNQLEAEYAKNFLGQKLEVLIEETDELYAIGHTSNYLKVKVKEKIKPNSFCVVTITDIIDNTLIGTIEIQETSKNSPQMITN